MYDSHLVVWSSVFRSTPSSVWHGVVLIVTDLTRWYPRRLRRHVYFFIWLWRIANETPCPHCPVFIFIPFTDVVEQNAAAVGAKPSIISSIRKDNLAHRELRWILIHL